MFRPHKKAVRKSGILTTWVVDEPQGPEGGAPRVILSPPPGRLSAWPLSCVWEFPINTCPEFPTGGRWSPSAVVFDRNGSDPVQALP